MQSQLTELQALAGIPVTESLQNHKYVFMIIDPMSGEYTEYYRGSPFDIVNKLQRDPENNMIADVLKQQKLADLAKPNGRLSFRYDDHIYAFVPL